MTESNQNNDNGVVDEEKKAKQLKKDRILLVFYVIAVLSVAFYLDKKITETKGQQYYDNKRSINPSKP